MERIDAVRPNDLSGAGYTPLEPKDFTIAITVYNRRDFVLQAVESALNQTMAVKVLVVEDCSPDTGMRAFIEDRFGSSITYHRNATRRGLFGNWNVCLELCSTPWLSILHDDDRLAPGFVEAMIALEKAMPNRGIYFSGAIPIDESNRRLQIPLHQFSGAFRELEPRILARYNDVLFPGQLFRVDKARSLGGFREASQFCADWEMWFKLAYYYGAAQTAQTVAYCRVHEGIDRGTNRVDRLGRKQALDFVQAKRNFAIVRKTFPDEYFDRRKALSQFPVPIRQLLRNASSMTPRMLRYNTSLLLQSRAPNRRYAGFQAAARIFGPSFVLLASRLIGRRDSK